MIDIQTATAENRRGKKKKEEDRKKKKPQDRNIMACPIPQGGYKTKCKVVRLRMSRVEFIQLCGRKTK